MANNESTGFVDPLKNIIDKTKEAYGITEDTPTPNISTVQPPSESFDDVDLGEPTKAIIQPGSIDIPISDDDDDEFGKNDFAKQLKAEEERMNEIEQAAYKKRQDEIEAANKSKVVAPPQSLDKQFQSDSIDVQNQHLAIVTGMIETVKAKYHLVGRIIPEKQRMVQGDLLEIYYNTGDKITPEFEQIIINNWQHINPDTGEEYEVDENNNVNPTKKTSSSDSDERTININVTSNQPVTVNLPEDLNTQIEKTKTNVVQVNVREVTDMDLSKMTIIENPQDVDDTIIEQTNNMGSVPVTLPLSGYRCTIRPVNYFEMIDLVAPRSDSRVAFMIQRWNVIYQHLENPSIGEFKDFEDFIKKTKYADLPILEWAILVATCDEYEPIEITCGNPKCRKKHNFEYSPRSIIHLNEDRLPKEYRQIADAAGPNAIELFTRINTKREQYKLKNTPMAVEINEPSAYDYITKKLPLIISKYREKKPDDPNMENFDIEHLSDDPTLISFSYKVACMMRIDAILQFPNNNTVYRFTEWDDIEKKIDGIKNMDDSLLVVKLIMEARDDASPAEFYLSEVKCPYCGRVDHRIPIDSITQNLLFRISRRLENMEIVLNKLD